MKTRLSGLLLLLALTVSTVQAQEKKGKFDYAGFSGGMMIHTGYLYGGSIALTAATNEILYLPQELSGAPIGIGGVARIHFGKHLRVGFEGYNTTLKYGKYDSYASIGWGGGLADCMWRFGKWAPYIGGTFGGGSFKNLTLIAPTPLDEVVETHSSFRKYGFVTVVPFAGVEFAMTEKIRLNVKIDWMVNLSNPQSDFVSGPRVYFGFSFYRLKE